MLPDPGSWAWLGLGSALDGISGVTREGTLSDKPHVVCGPQKKRAPRLSLATFLVSAHGDRERGQMWGHCELGNLLWQELWLQESGGVGRAGSHSSSMRRASYYLDKQVPACTTGHSHWTVRGEPELPCAVPSTCV